MDEILGGIERDLELEMTVQYEPMRGDRWLWVSSMQKAIRRNEVERASQAAISLLREDSRKLWFRLGIIAVEDIGIGSPDVTAKVLATVASPAWYQATGEQRVAIHLVKIMCEAVKSRLGDALYTLVDILGIDDVLNTG